MSTYEQKDNSGAIFKNEKRESEKHPNLTGSLLVAGVDYWVSAWTNVSKNGKKYISLSLTPKEEQAAAAAPAAKSVSDMTLEDLDEDIPF